MKLPIPMHHCCLQRLLNAQVLVWQNPSSFLSQLLAEVFSLAPDLALLEKEQCIHFPKLTEQSQFEALRPKSRDILQM